MVPADNPAANSPVVDNLAAGTAADILAVGTGADNPVADILAAGTGADTEVVVDIGVAADKRVDRSQDQSIVGSAAV